MRYITSITSHVCCPSFWLFWASLALGSFVAVGGPGQSSSSPRGRVQGTHSRALVPRAADVDCLALSPRGTVGCLRITALTALTALCFSRPVRPLSCVRCCLCRCFCLHLSFSLYLSTCKLVCLKWSAAVPELSRSLTDLLPLTRTVHPPLTCHNSPPASLVANPTARGLRNPISCFAALLFYIAALSPLTCIDASCFIASHSIKTSSLPVPSCSSRLSFVLVAPLLLWSAAR